MCKKDLRRGEEDDQPGRYLQHNPEKTDKSIHLKVDVVVVVVVVLTDRASTIPSNIRGCQSGTWSQRGTKKVNGSHHGDNPLLRPTGIQIATKRYATLQAAMAPTDNKTVHQTSFTPYREQPRSTRIVVAYPRPVEFSTISTLESVIFVSSDYLCINWYGSSLGVYTRVGVPRLQCLGQ